MTTRQDVVALARSFIGSGHYHGYDEANPFSEDLGRPVEAWCFTEEVLISTPGGLRSIADLHEGDEVITADGDVSQVTASNSRLAPTLTVKAQGLHGTQTTAEHPFWARRRASTRKREFDVPEWIAAGKLQRGDLIFMPRRSDGSVEMDPHKAYIVGRYLADGWKSMKASRATGTMYPRWFLCSSHEEAEGVGKALRAAGIDAAQYTYRTVEQFSITRGVITDVLADAGSNAGDKRVPAEVMTWNEMARQSFLTGYLDGDGSESSEDSIYARANTVSRSLVYGIAEVARSLNLVPSIYRYGNERLERIEGREVHVRPRYEIHLRHPQESNVQSIHEATGDWVPVRSVESSDPAEVFNLTVADTHTFIADGAAVHNCGDYVTDIYKRAGLLIPSMQAGCHTGFAYVPSAWDVAGDRAARQNSWQGAPGDLAIFHFPGDTPGADHVEMVVEWSGGVLTTVGGNSTANGGVNEHEWEAPAGVGNPDIMGVIDMGKFVTFGQPAKHHAPAKKHRGHRLLMLKSPLMRGKDVKVVEKALKKHPIGKDIIVDGYYGVILSQAIGDFQKNHGLHIDRIVGPQTRKALGIKAWQA